MSLVILIVVMVIATIGAAACLHRHLSTLDVRATLRAAIYFSLYAPGVAICTNIGEGLGLNIVVSDVITAASVLLGLIAVSLWIDYFSRRHP